ncbi:hypothetical protein Tco_1121661 [Tanacetum coccineum]|uniref:Uncharacterized protein n=1 Tax=Tanacetum coccineum TaxID=301880 RepID=A0ABQ5IYC1_9ASTR
MLLLSCLLVLVCDANKKLGLHNQLMKLTQFLMGLDDCYQSVRSALLTRDPLPEVKDAYTTVSREESHRRIPEPSNVTESKINATSFAAKSYPPGFKKVVNPIKQSGFKQSFNSNSDTKSNEKMPTSVINALGWHLEEIYVTWAHLEKKRTRLQLYTKVNEENAYGDGVRNPCDAIRIAKRRWAEKTIQGVKYMVAELNIIHNPSLVNSIKGMTRRHEESTREYGIYTRSTLRRSTKVSQSRIATLAIRVRQSNPTLK